MSASSVLEHRVGLLPVLVLFGLKLSVSVRSVLILLAVELSVLEHWVPSIGVFLAIIVAVDAD